MNKPQNTFMTPSQFTMFLISIFTGVGMLYLPNSVIKDAKQSGWISCIIGAFYPLIIVIIAYYVCRKFPNDDIITLSKKCLGNVLGNIFNIIFLTFFIFMATSELSALANVFKVYTTPFLKSYQIFLCTLTVIAYIAYKGIKPLARLNEVIFYMAIAFVFIPGAALRYGSYLNLMPVFGCGIKDLFKASKEMLFFYTGGEVLFLIYPFLQDKKKFMKCGITSVIFTACVYTWFTFSTIYYLGIDISPKYLWPTLTLADTLNIPIITSFRYVFVSLWALVILRCLAVYYFSSCYGLSRVIKGVSTQKFAIILYPIIILLASLYGNPTTRRAYTNIILKCYVIYNLIYILVITTLMRFKKGDDFEKK